jgi:hypothetical protein
VPSAIANVIVSNEGCKGFPGIGYPSLQRLKGATHGRLRILRNGIASDLDSREGGRGGESVHFLAFRLVDVINLP